MLSFSKCKFALGCAIILIIFANFWMPLQLFDPRAEIFRAQVSQQEPEHETVSEKMNRKRKILDRGCSMIGILYEMSQNGTSYENLLALHSKIHDLDFPLRQVFKKIIPESGIQILANERPRTL